jgi:outer membrane protein assembly factor BamB
MVLVGVADGRPVALDRESGRVIWQVQAERWQEGFAITTAPLYFDGKLRADQIRAVMTAGRNNMPTLREIYDANQLRDVSEYISQQQDHRAR